LQMPLALDTQKVQEYNQLIHKEIII
jgi:hypothetical protein